jgi:hypothetical protein
MNWSLPIIVGVACFALLLLMLFILFITKKKDYDYCPNREDKIHCACWWDGYACCSCGAPDVMEDWLQ